MLVVVESKWFDAGGRNDGIEEFSGTVLVGLKADGLKGLDENCRAPKGFRLEFESVGRVVGLGGIIGVGGNDVVWVTGGGDRVGAVT